MSFRRTDMHGAGQRSFETLESRTLMAAPTAAVVGMSTDAISLTMIVDWTNTDPDTLTNNDFQMTRVGRVAVPGVMLGDPALVAGKWRATYKFVAYDNAWGVSDNGTFNFTSPLGAVLSPQGDPVDNTLVHSRGLWWSTPKSRLTSQSLTGTDWLITIQYDTANGVNASTIDPTDLSIPAGYTDGITVQSITPINSTSSRVVYKVKAPGGAWDYFDSRNYQFSIPANAVRDASARAVTAHNYQTFSPWFAAPRAQVLGTAVNENDWIIPVLYTARPGQSINPASIVVGDSPVFVTGPSGFSRDATISQLIHNPNGTYTAYFRVEANGGSWDFRDNGAYTLKHRANRVADSANATVPAYDMKVYNLWFSTPAAEITTQSANLTRWDITVRFRDDVQLDRSSILAASIRVVGPDGLELSGTLQSLTGPNPGNTVTAVFRFLPPEGWLPGQYQVWLNREGVRDSQGRISAENLLGSYTLAP
jgi:large repetitive protein